MKRLSSLYHISIEYSRMKYSARISSAALMTPVNCFSIDSSHLKSDVYSLISIQGKIFDFIVVQN